MKNFKLIIALFIVLAFVQTAWAQATSNNLPAEVRAEDATITEFGHATMTVEVKIVTDSLTHRTDTLYKVTNIEWNTPSGTAKQRIAQRGNNPNGSGFYNQGSNSWLDIYWYRFNYPSINAEGRPVLLSALTCMPDEDCDYINNVIIGCHVTITSNGECPSEYSTWDNWNSDVGMLMNHAGSGLFFHSAQSNMAYYNLVIMPDYEGYGLTRSHAHPYLFQELTARQVVDGVRYGIALYKSSPIVSSIRHPFRSDWRSISVGYSQGGSVALATQRFIEQNGLSNELHLAGSVCGDGPYDPVATLMYYVWQYTVDHNPLSMPVVMPLILKGMCDSNPYMKNHQVSDYLSSGFLATNILQWLTDKEKTTDDITAAWLRYYMSIPDYEHVTPDGEALLLGLNYVLKTEGYNFFRNLYNAHSSTYTSAAGVPLPAHRGLFEDLHYALASNNLTKGWVPQHTVCLYHSYDDSVVPEVNRQSALNSLGNWVIQLHASGTWQFDHVGSGRQFYLGTAEFDAIRELAKLPVRQTTQHAINVKNSLPEPDVDQSPSINPANDVVRDSVTLNGQKIEAEYSIKGSYACLGSGYNACISQYLEGKVEIPGTITVDGVTYQVNEISDMAFRMCNKITEVVVPVNVYHIGNFAFQGCQTLTTVSLPSTLTTIGSGAFIDLPRLDRIDIHAETPPLWLYNDVFKFHDGGIGDNATYTYDNILLCVPEGKITAYRNAKYDDSSLGWTTREGWGNFPNIVNTASEDAEAYVTYKNGTLTFYYDTHRQHRVDAETYGLTSADYASSLGFPGWLKPGHSHANDITTVVFNPLFSYARLETTSRWFRGCVNLDTIIGMHHLNTEGVTNMSDMFYNCTSLTDDDLDLSRFNTASVTNMSSMFEGCTGIVSPDLSSFDTRNCIQMQNMFYGCTNLTSIDLSSFETTDCRFDQMFYNCHNLESVNIGSFSATDNYMCNGMFVNCSNLHELVIPTAFNILNGAFYGCTRLRDVYCYRPVPYDIWTSCDTDFILNKVTRFHVLVDTYDDWVEAYGEDSATPANVTFVGDLGTETNPYLLYSTADWVNLGQLVDNDICVNAKMMNDFSVTTMLGNNLHYFSGIFDGNGHTLTVDYNITSDETIQDDIFPAPFVVIRNATIKNLRLEGTIAVTSERNGAAGLVGACLRPSNNESVTNLITNCHVSTHISGKIHFMGGIVAGVDERIATTISGCLFDGRLSADHDYYLVHDVQAGAIACEVDNAATVTVVDCVENGSYENADTYTFCPITTTNSYRFNDGLTGNAKRAYSISTHTEGLILDFGTSTATYDVSGITAYNLGMKINGVFHAGTGETAHVALSAPGYEYNLANITFTSGANIVDTGNGGFNITLPSNNVIITLPMTFTTIVLYADARDNSLKLGDYIDENYNVQFVGQTLSKSVQWNPICLPFDLPSLNGTPLQNYVRLKVLDTITFENKVAVYHFEDATSITADNLYLIQMRDNVVDPTYSRVTIKRSSAPGMKMEAVEGSQTGFTIKGNYNYTDLEDLDPDGDLHTMLFYNGTTLRKVSNAHPLKAFNWCIELFGVTADDVVACLLDIDGGANSLVILDNRYGDVDDIFYREGNWDDYENWAKESIPGLGSKVLIEANVTIPADCVATAREIVRDRGYFLIKDGGQLVHNSWGLQAYVEKIFERYHPYLEKDGYYLITNPVEEEQNPEYLSDMVMGYTVFDLYYYDQSEPLEWRNYKKNPFNLENGKGYLYASEYHREIEFGGRIRPANADVSVSIVYDAYANVPGFNLVGNPFVCNAYLADGRDFYVLSEDGDEVVAATDNVIAPMQGLFVQAEEFEEELVFTTTAPTKGKVLNMSLTRDQDVSALRPFEWPQGPQAQGPQIIDNARIRFGEGHNLEKVQLNPDHSKIFISQGGKDYAAVSVGRDVSRNVSTEIPVNFKAEENGTYTLSFNTEGIMFGYLHLIDTFTGANVDLLVPEATQRVEGLASYTFTAKTTDDANRFRLVFYLK